MENMAFLTALHGLYLPDWATDDAPSGAHAGVSDVVTAILLFGVFIAASLFLLAAFNSGFRTAVTGLIGRALALIDNASFN